MSNYASHNTYQPPEEAQEFYHSPSIQHTGETISVSVRDGQVSASVSTKDSVRSSELTPYSESDWRSTALKPSGFPATEITSDTIVTLYGQQGRVQDFVRAGVLQETSNGFEMIGSESAQSESLESSIDHPDAASLPQEMAQTIDVALEPFNQSTLDAGLSLALSSVTGDVDFSAVVRNVAMRSGLEPKDVQQRVQFTIDAYQAQTDNYVTRNGITKGDLEGFYEFCQANKRELTAVLQQQMYQRDMSGWKGLISRFQSSTAPSLEVLQENGFQTRTLAKEAEVRINGIWMTIGAAAKAGLI